MKKQHLIVAFSVILGVLIHALVYTSPPGKKYEHAAFDTWFNVEQLLFSIRGERPAKPKEVVLIAMDEQSYEPLGLSFTKAWPRAIHGALLERLKELGAHKVAFDILFLGPTTPENDQRLQYGLSLLPTVIGAELPPRLEESSEVGIYTEQLNIPYEPFLDVSDIGLVGYRLTDGKVRQFFIERPKEFFTDATGIAEAAVSDQIGEADRPDENDYIRFYGPSDTIETLSYYQVLETGSERNNEYLRSKISGKVVFVALKRRTELGYAQKDTFNVPFFNDSVYGGEIHATAAVNLLRGDFIRRSTESKELIWLTLIGIVVLTIMYNLDPVKGFLFVILTIISWVGAAYSAFQFNFFLPGINLLTIIGISYTTSTLYLYFVVKAEQGKILKAVSVYVGPQMAKEVAESDFKLELGGSEVEATIMFTDIAGFTPISESMSPSEVADMLNNYFGEVMEVVFDHKGTLLKFIGDAVFVIWGAPLPQEDQADLSLITALDIQEKVELFNSKSRYPDLYTRIGINTGSMVFGNLGTSQRYDYTAIGDEVNLGARVEGINKYLGTTILITESTYVRLKDKSPLLPMGSVKVVGKDTPVELYSPISSLLEDGQIDQWLQAISHFRQREWTQAGTLFEEIAKAQALLEKAATRYLNDIEIFSSVAPDDSWAGELVFSSK